jgi:iron(III) transport system substrate-binding protein
MQYMRRRLSRRHLVRAMAGGALGVAAIPALAACVQSTGRDDVTEEEAGLDDIQDDTPPEGETDADEEESLDDFVETGGQVTVYSGRGRDLVEPILHRFGELTGIDVRVRYGDTAEMAAAILEEGQNTPADVYYGQDAGALGALANEGMLRPLPETSLELVDSRFRSDEGLWVGTSGRARTVIYNTDLVDEGELPASILDYVDPRWEGQLGWSPTNGSFQAWVTALRIIEGEDVAREWLEGIQALNPLVYEGNTPIVRAAMAGEISAGFVNHYYLYRERAEAGGDVGEENYFFTDGDIGGLINVAGVAITDPARNVEQAEMLVEFLLSQEAQEYFRIETFEYPLAAGIPAHEDLPSLDEIQSPDIDLSNLDDLEGTLALLQEVGLL